MTGFVIDKNVPIPKKVNRRIYPFYKMEVGESFLVSIDDEKNKFTQKQRIYIAIWRFCQVETEMKFTTSSIDGGVRVWRIK